MVGFLVAQSMNITFRHCYCRFNNIVLTPSKSGKTRRRIRENLGICDWALYWIHQNPAAVLWACNPESIKIPQVFQNCTVLNPSKSGKNQEKDFWGYGVVRVNVYNLVLNTSNLQLVLGIERGPNRWAVGSGILGFLPSWQCNRYGRCPSRHWYLGQGTG